MSIVLIGRDLSPFVRRTATTLNLLGLSYTREEVAAAEAVDFIRQYNPLGRVPALIIGNDVVIDSAAIIDYALELAGKQSLLSPSGEARRSTLKQSAIATGVMEKGVVAAYEVTQRPQEYLYEPYRERVLEQVLAGLQELDEMLGEAAFFGGTTPDLADVNTVVAYDFICIVAKDKIDSVNLNRMARLSARANSLNAFALTRWQG